MTARALSSYIFVDKYSNHIEGEKRRETWIEAGDRVFGMHEKKYDSILPKIKEHIVEARAAFDDMLALGSQRILQFGGMPVLKKEARAFNCTVSFVDRPRMFQEAFWLLLCGCGVGFSVQWHHIEKLPSVIAPAQAARRAFNVGASATQTLMPVVPVKVFVVPDTIEGWADALGVLLSSYFDSDDTPFPEYRGCHVEFDFSLIRPKGSKLSSGSGRAPGFEPLKKSLDMVRSVLQRACAKNETFDWSIINDKKAADFARRGLLQPIDCYDILMHASDAVLSGGVRRSASICIFSPDDSQMARSKIGNWTQDNPQRGRSNNSALLLRGKTSFKVFNDLVQLAREWGEPGFFWADSTECIPNPCVEIGMWPVWNETMETGWQFCNLSLINMAKVKTKQDFARAARAAAIMGTMQAGYTNFAYLGEVSEKITRHEALLGVSMTGMMEAPSLAFDPETLQEMAKIVLDTNAEVAELIGINPCARGTCVKPEGTSSCLLETCSGIHPHHAPMYFRRVQANENEPPALFFSASNPNAVEKSMWSANGTDIVLTFCIEAPEGSIFSKDVSALDLLEKVKLVKENWVDAGKRVERCAQPWLSHNVSNTVYVGTGEWDAVANFIYEHQDTYAGVSLLKRSGDLDYPQAPFVEVMGDEQLQKTYGDEKIAVARKLVDQQRDLFQNLWVACDTAEQGRLGIGIDLNEPLKEAHDKINNAVGERHKQRRFCADVFEFSRKFFGGNVVETGYCLKNVYNHDLWLMLTATTVDIDYKDMREEEDNTNFEAQAACAGGSCSIV
jgi:ribonucleoside-triphosphate reductase